MTYGSLFGVGDSADRPASDTRVGDAERQQVVDNLIRAHSLGQLDLTEFDERSSKAWNAKTQTDLVGLTADLPSSIAPVRASRSGSGGGRRGWAPPTAALGFLRLFLLAAVAIAVVSVIVGHLFFFWPLWLVLWLVLSGRVGGRGGRGGWQHPRAYQRY